MLIRRHFCFLHKVTKTSINSINCLLYLMVVTVVILTILIIVTVVIILPHTTRAAQILKPSTV